MKLLLVLFAFLSIYDVPGLNASNVHGQTNNYQQGTIVSVETHQVWSPAYSGGDNPSDAPLQSKFYEYQVAVQVDCGTYVARYDSPINYLPSVFAPKHAVRVRLTKHSMYFNLPMEGEMKMAIGHRRTLQTGSCSAGAQL